MARAPEKWFSHSEPSCSAATSIRPWACSTARRAIPKAIRAYVMERDGYACVECGATDDLSLDHIHPYSQGGTDEPDNLRVLCRSCNSRKGART